MLNLRSESQLVPFRQLGQYEDEELEGLYYNRYRYYDSNSGNYISQDPIGLEGNNPNFYAYVHDANKMVDPFGLSAGILTIYSHSPKGDLIGHAFIGVTDGSGKTKYIGQWPDPGFSKEDLGRIMVSDMPGALDKDDTRYLNDPDTVSKSYNLTSEQLDSVNKYIDEFDAKNANGKGYNLRNRQCASFAYGAAKAAKIKELKILGWVTPSSLSKKIKHLCK